MLQSPSSTTVPKAGAAATPAPAPCALTIVTPTFNEAENVEPFVAAVRAAMPQIGYEILVVDDDSPDLTWHRVETIAQRDERVRVLRRTGARGLSAAVIDGFSTARGDMVACIDCDLQHDPSILPRMIQELLSGADVVVGSRYVAGGGVGQWGFIRRLGSLLATRLALAAVGVSVLDPMSGYFVLRRRDFDRIRPRVRAAGFKILLEIIAAFDSCVVREIPYTFAPRKFGKSKMDFAVGMSYFGQVCRLALRRRFRAGK